MLQQAGGKSENRRGSLAEDLSSLSKHGASTLVKFTKEEKRKPQGGLGRGLVSPKGRQRGEIGSWKVKE